jgi:hypothetical protein
MQLPNHYAMLAMLVVINGSSSSRYAHVIDSPEDYFQRKSWKGYVASLIQALLSSEVQRGVTPTKDRISG